MDLNKRMTDKKFALIVSIAITCLVFSVFVGQALFSDIITFSKMEDSGDLCYLSFLKLGDMLSLGILGGCDLGTFNGASEMFYRSNIPVMYVPAMIFALIGRWLSQEYLMYMLLFIIHFWGGIYFAQRLGQRFFGMNRWLSLLLAFSCIPLFLYEMWYSSFAIITSLVFPLLYFSLLFLDGCNKRYWVLSPLIYILALTSGYSTLSVMLAAIVFGISILYAYLYKTELPLKTRIIRILFPVLSAGAICFLYYLGVLVYVKTIVQPVSSINFALELEMDIRSLPKIIFNSYPEIVGIEQFQIINLGIIWSIAICVMLVKKVTRYMKRSESVFLKTTISINLLLLIITFGKDTPVAAWFYSIAPILGQMHLPIRFLMVTMPLGFLALCIGLKSLPDNVGARSYRRLFWAFAIVVLLVSTITSVVSIPLINPEKLILELFLSTVVLYYLSNYGWHSGKTIVSWCMLMLILGTELFYSANEITVPQSEFSNRSILDNNEDQERLSKFMEGLEDKYLFRYLCLDDTNMIYSYIPQNYAWYQSATQNTTLSNYLGYELHLAVPNDYTRHFPWFQSIDWKYVTNTRGDFIAVDQTILEDNQDIFSQIIDRERNSLVFTNGMQLYALKKFIPSFYTGGESFVEDREDSFDNGYLYSPTLTDRNILEFTTDGATYYQARINSKEDATIALLFYPNRFYKYYIDGNEVDPTIYESQAFIDVPKGEHELYIAYENGMQTTSNIIMISYYIACSIVGTLWVLCSIRFVVKKKSLTKKNNKEQK